MLESDFIGEDDFDAGNDDTFEAPENIRDTFDVDLPEPRQPNQSLRKPDAKPEVEIEIVDDTPEKDKGKWVADDAKDGEPDFGEDDEVASHDRDIQKRIKRFTARVHAERRAKEEVERQLEEARKLATTLIERNNKLSDLVENGEKVLVGEHKGRIQSELQAAKTFYREAHEAGDVNGMAQAQERIALAAAALDRLSTHQPMKLERESVEDFNQRVPAPKPRVSADTEEWQNRNPWFGKDQVMTAFAFGVHAELVKNQNVSAESPEYWKRLDGEIRKRFPEKFQRPTPQPQRRSIVAPAGRQSGNGAQRVTLTETQVKLAKRLGLTAEQYAMQVLKDQQSRNI